MKGLGCHITVFDNGFVQHRAVEIGGRQVTVDDACIAQVGVAQVGTVKIAAIENSVTQIGMTTIDTAQVTVFPVHTAQLAVVELAATHHAIGKACPLQVSISQRCPGKISTVRCGPAGMQAIEQRLFLGSLLFFQLKLPERYQLAAVPRNDPLFWVSEWVYRLFKPTVF